MSPQLPGSLVGEIRSAALPLASYYAVTLVMPVTNGAALSDAFATHAVVVLLVPLAIVVSMTALRIAIRKSGRSLHARRTCGRAFTQAMRTTKPVRGGTKPTKKISMQETS